MTAPRLAMTGVSKRFGATQALSEVSLSVERSSVRALIGENGAGKSTLMKILSGVHHPDNGSMSIDGRPYRPMRPIDGRHAGIAMIYQELNLAPHLSVLDNIMLGQERARGGILRLGQQRSLARQALEKLSQSDLSLDLLAGDLPIAKQQIVEIARALVSEAKVLVFDEPTSSLTEQDTARLFEVIRSLRQQGFAVVYISHFLEEVAEIADVFTVLRDGQVVGEGQIADVSLDEIIHLMVGRELDDLFPKVPHEPEDDVLSLSELTGRQTPTGVSLSVRRGEILGIAGLVGAGRSELVRCIYGLDRVQSGHARIVAVGPVARNPQHSIRSGLGLVSEDRKDEGLALEMSISDNLTFTRLGQYGVAGWLNLRRRDATVKQWMNTIKCKAVSPQQTIDQLSGGNQQKIAIARLLHQQADILLLDEPTRGIDIGTKAQVYGLIGQLAAEGRSVILVSSYLPELLNVCDRIAVMCRGRLREIRDAAKWDEESIMHCATGRE